MKRIVIAVAGVGLVVAAISVARANSGEDSTPDAQAPTTSAPSQQTDVSHEFDRELTTEQIERQTEQVLKAQQELKDQVKRAAESADD